MKGEEEIRAEQLRAEKRSYRKLVEIELRAHVREVSELLIREDQPDWGLVHLLLNNAAGRAAHIIDIEKRRMQPGEDY